MRDIAISISHPQIYDISSTHIGAKSMPKLTQKLIDIRERPKTGQEILKDQELTGFAVRFTPNQLLMLLNADSTAATKD